MLTPRQFAEAKNVAYTTVMFWLNQGLIKGARKNETPTGHYWEIPATLVETFERPKAGRPAKAAVTAKAGKKAAKTSAKARQKAKAVKTSTKKTKTNATKKPKAASGTDEPGKTEQDS